MTHFGSDQGRPARPTLAMLGQAGLAWPGPRDARPAQAQLARTSRASENAVLLRVGREANQFSLTRLNCSNVPWPVRCLWEFPVCVFFSKFQSTPHDGRTEDVICTRLKEGTVQHKKDGNGWCVALYFHRRRGGVETAPTQTCKTWHKLCPVQHICSEYKADPREPPFPP